jgi:hypothetical protein
VLQALQLESAAERGKKMCAAAGSSFLADHKDAPGGCAAAGGANSGNLKMDPCVCFALQTLLHRARRRSAADTHSLTSLGMVRSSEIGAARPVDWVRRGGVGAEGCGGKWIWRLEIFFELGVESPSVT